MSTTAPAGADDRNWSYPDGLQAWEVAADPATPEGALVNLVLNDPRTWWAMHSHPSARTSVRVAEHLARVLLSAKGNPRYDRWGNWTDVEDDEMDRMLVALLDVPVSTSHLTDIVWYASVSRELVDKLATHPSTDDRALIDLAIYTEEAKLELLKGPDMPLLLRASAAIRTGWPASTGGFLEEHARKLAATGLTACEIFEGLAAGTWTADLAATVDAAISLA